MAKQLLGSSCHGAPPRGLFLALVLLLLASIKAAGPVMAEPEDLIVNGLEKLTTAALGKVEGMEDFAKGLKGGFKAHKVYSKVQALINRQNPGARGTTYFVDTVIVTGGTKLSISTVDITATAAVRTGFCTAGVPRPSYIGLFGNLGKVNLTVHPLPGTLQDCSPDLDVTEAVLGLGRGGAFRNFSYLVMSDAYTVVWFPPAPASRQQQKDTATIPLNNYYLMRYRDDGLYYVDITGIRVGQHQTVQTTTAYLNTTQPYTYLERGMYDRFEEALVSQIQGLNPAVATPARRTVDGPLCYEATALTVPTMAILFADGKAMELRGPNVWYTDQGSSTTICLGILPTPRPGQVSILGGRLQSGRPMTVDYDGGWGYTLTFPAFCDGTSCLLDTSNSKRTSRVSPATYVLYFAVPLLVLLCQGRVVIII